MRNIALSAEGLGKRYLIGQVRAYRTLRETLTDPWRRLFRRESIAQPKRPSIWALKDVSFEVQQGEIVGVIGRNGSGKSTLLKVLSRITEPTEGEAKIRGRVGSLLEVGTGFHPELTGRENIYLNAAILGMRRFEITRKLDQIVAFSEVEQFLDTPVKFYSSGMYMRLAFAVAAHLEPEILVVDEVLAVGDIQFQQKCMGRMGEVASGGRTVIFVSHNMSAINHLCQRCVYLDHGRVVSMGTTPEVVGRYLANERLASGVTRSPESGPLYADDEFEVRAFFACDPAGRAQSQFKTSEPVCVCIQYTNKKDLPGLRIGIDVVDCANGEVLFRAYDDDVKPCSRDKNRITAIGEIPANLLKSGQYRLDLMICVHYIRWIVHGTIAEMVHVEHLDGVNSRYNDPRPGVMMPATHWDLRYE